jgi:hypothetical protein
MTDIVWSAHKKGNLKALADHERDHTSKFIPAGSPVLYWEKVSFWRNPLNKPPRQATWPLSDPERVAYFCLESGSPAEAGWVRWVQPSERVY